MHHRHQHLKNTKNKGILNMNNQTIFTKTALLAILSILSLQVNAKEYQATLNFKNGLSVKN
jgi:hypothetical protein